MEVEDEDLEASRTLKDFALTAEDREGAEVLSDLAIGEEEMETLRKKASYGLFNFYQQSGQQEAKRRQKEAQMEILQKKLEEEAQYPAGDTENLDTATLTGFSRSVFGDSFIEEIQSRLYGAPLAKALRQFWTGQSGDQCKGALVGKDAFSLEKSGCQICGQKFSSKNPDFMVECEHVFPVAQAIFFIDLYRGRNKTSPEDLKRLRLEQGWAHKICNRVKNDTHFLNSKYRDIRKRQWVVDPGRIRTFLIKLQSHPKFDLREVIPKQMKLSDWFTQRTQLIAKRCQAILDAGANQCYPALFILSSLANCHAIRQGLGRKTRRQKKVRKTRKNGLKH